MKFYVNDLSISKKFIKLFRHKKSNTTIYFCVWHKELKLWQNLLANCFFMITQKKNTGGK